MICVGGIFTREMYPATDRCADRDTSVFDVRVVLFSRFFRALFEAVFTWMRTVNFGSAGDRIHIIKAKKAVTT